MTVTALHNTLQTPSNCTHCCFTRQRCHSLPQIRAFSGDFTTLAYQKLFVAWTRRGLRSYFSSEAMTIGLCPSHSRPMDPKSSRGLVTRPFEFGMQAPASRCSHPFEAMMASLIPPHSHPMDPKSSRGLLTRPFEFGMQALASKCSHPFEAMMAGLGPSHSRPMDPKSSRGQMT